MQSFRFLGITSTGVKVDEMITAFNADSPLGAFGILFDCSPMAASLKECKVRYELNGEEKSLMVKDGFLEMRDNTLTLIAGELSEV